MFADYFSYAVSVMMTSAVAKAVCHMKTMLQLSNLLKVDIAVLLGVMACGGVKIMGTALFSVVFLRWCAFIILCVLCFCHCIDLCVCVIMIAKLVMRKSSGRCGLFVVSYYDISTLNY